MLPKSPYFLGIDPGVNGAYAFYNSPRDYHVFDCTSDYSQLLEHLRKYEPVSAVLEKVSSMPRMGVRSMFTFGGNYEMWKVLCHVQDIPLDLESPNEWRVLARLNIPTYKTNPKLSKDKNSYERRKIQKKYLLEEGRRRFPMASLKRVQDVDRVEALFIAFTAQQIFKETYYAKKRKYYIK